ncbi:hypothetical protein UFOVP6_6 [uncultured Caudovirales phage]|uniref:Uncharacterized protein n=1 Tax=uncultured Caudovirales phage TaxID=2100421 RepID=A0A6J5KKZ5_9CAUD|nr:hypothetical protein UFOVP6_6 [uncultured Caudovirales phage]
MTSAPMFVIFWTTIADMADHYEVTHSESTAQARCNQLAERDGVYAWGMAPIARASEPHWEGWKE